MTQTFSDNVPGTWTVEVTGTNQAYGLVAHADGWALLADSAHGSAVAALCGGPQPAVYADCTNGPGIIANSSHSDAVIASAADQNRAVLAVSQNGPAIEAASETAAGVYANSTDGAGVYAYSVNRNAVYGTSSNGNGVFGVAQAGGVGVAGLSVSGWAGWFRGPVLVQGSFTVVGGAKSAAVPHPDGSHRRLYSLECPESWFKDFGEGALRNGKGAIKLDRDFAALVHRNSYHVFLTPKGDSNGLYVTRQAPGGFEVREQNGGKSSIGFSYRVVAKRKDIRGPRLEKVTLSTLEPMTRLKPGKLPKMPKLPKIARNT